MTPRVANFSSHYVTKGTIRSKQQQTRRISAEIDSWKSPVTGSCNFAARNKKFSPSITLQTFSYKLWRADNLSAFA
jgi:hypothetical protein